MHFFSFSNTSMPTPTHMLLGQLPVCVLIAVLTARGGWQTLVAACHCQQARLPCDWRTRPKLGSQSVILVSPSLPPRAQNLLNNVIYWRGGWGCLQQQYTCPNNPHPPPPSNVLFKDLEPFSDVEKSYFFGTKHRIIMHLDGIWLRCSFNNAPAHISGREVTLSSTRNRCSPLVSPHISQLTQHTQIFDIWKA